MNIINAIPTTMKWGILAQAELDPLKEKGISTIMVFALLLCVGGLIFAGYNLLRGNIEFAIHAVLGALLIGASGYIATKMIETFSSL